MIPPVSSVPAAITGVATGGSTQAPAQGFGDTIASALESVSQAEFDANALATDVALGGDTSVQELMVAMTKASLSVDLLVQVRNKAVEAYQEIMRMQI